YKNIHHFIRLSAGQIKKFVHSYLNSVKKEDMVEEYLIVDVLINNQMLEELVNYNFVSDGTIAKLWDFLFKKDSYDDGSYYDIFLRYDRGNLDFAPKRAKELLLSWDKVENRHALSTLWTLLAKRGDLQKIFGPEKAEEIKKAE
ncbi:MAG: hypothetical protein Q8L57_02955, partial [bacterium]|nr:hypothetical protein [bacterium]